MIVYIRSLLIVLLEKLCCKIFFEIFEEKRNEKQNMINTIIMAVLVLFVFLMVVLLADYLILKAILIITITSIFMYMIFRIHIVKSFILSILYQGLLLVVDYSVVLVVFSFFNYTIDIRTESGIGMTLMIVLCKTVLFFCVLFIKRSIGKKSSSILDNIEWLKFMFFPIFSICIIIAIISDLDNMRDHKSENILLMIAFGLAGMNIVVFYLMNDIIKRESKIREHKIFNMKVKNQTQMYHSISKNFDIQRKRTHEYKNQILCIDSLISDNNYKELKKYIKTIYKSLSKDMDFINTNNVIINAILNTKYQEAMRKGILFILKINDLSQIKITDEDIVVILSNLLNNAIEACEKCEEKRNIKLKLVIENGMTIISVKNTYMGNIIYYKDTIMTTKSLNREEHGIGINNIIETIKKYDGSYVIRSENQEFYFSILIPG